MRSATPLGIQPAQVGLSRLSRLFKKENRYEIEKQRVVDLEEVRGGVGVNVIKIHCIQV